MIVLRRCPGERVMVGEFFVTVVSFTDDSVELLIENRDDGTAVRRETLKVNESLTIPECEAIVMNIFIKPSDSVRLGFDAPTQVPIHREEVYQAILDEQLRHSSDKEAGDRGESENAAS